MNCYIEGGRSFRLSMSDECTGQVDETGGDIAQAVSEAVNSCNCRIMTVVSLIQHHNTK